MLKKFKIFETDEFQKRIDKLPHQDSEFIRKKLKDYVYPQIAEEPYFGKNIKKLKDFNPPTWRYRIGKFRVFYLIDNDEKVIFMLTIDLRKDIYKKH